MSEIHFPFTVSSYDLFIYLFLAGDDPAHKERDCLYRKTDYIAIKIFWNLHNFGYIVNIWFTVKKKIIFLQ